MSNVLYPRATPELHKVRTSLAPAQAEAFKQFSQAVFAAEMRAGGAYAHSILALDALGHPHRD